MMNASPATTPPASSTSWILALRRAAGRQQVVMDQHSLAGLDGVGVHLQSVRAVLEVVLAALDLPGQLAGLARAREADAEAYARRRPG